MLFVASLVLVLLDPVHTFQFDHGPQVASQRQSVVVLDAVNGASNGDEAFMGSGLIQVAGNAKSQLFAAFTSLDLTDQYDAVLTGLCAKILDDRTMDEQKAKVALQDPIQLVQEMNAKNIPASPRSLMALIDSAVKTQDAQTMARILSLCTKNKNGIRKYGNQLADILPLPTNPNSKVRCPDGSMKTRAQRLLSLPDIPLDDREKETAYALAFGGLLASCGATNVLSLDEIAPFTDTLFISVVTVGVVDNFYDILKNGAQFVASQVQKQAEKQQQEAGGGEPKKKSITSEPLKLPDKESLPLGLGTGKLSGTTIRGLSRLFTIDAERESQCEAAALYAAYALGLPCFAFRPNAYESSVLVAESTRADNDVDTLLSGSGIMRMLVWLMAPVAMESMMHPQLIMSDPREAIGFLKRLEEFGEKNEKLRQELWWIGNEQERQDLLKWAYAEADCFLRENRKSVNEIAKRLAGGAATIGDCVAVGENWL